MVQNLTLSARQIDAIARLAQGEFGAAANRTSDDPDKSSALYNGIRGVVDTVLNRAAEGKNYGGNTIEGVINARTQFEPVSKAGGNWENLPAARAAIKAIVAERVAEIAAGAPTRPFTFFDNPTTVKKRAGTDASQETVDRSRLGLLDPTGQFVSDPAGSHNYYSKPNFPAPRGFEVSLDDDAKGTIKDWSKAYSGVGWGNLNDSPSELGALARMYPAYGPKSVYEAPDEPRGTNLGGGLGDAPSSAGMSFTPKLPAPMPSVDTMAPGFRFSSMPFGIGAPDTARYDPLSSVRAPQAPAPQPGWGSIAGQAIGAARPPVRDYGPDWNTPGPGLPATSTPDYTTGSNGTFQKAPPSVMSAPSTKTYDPLSSIQAPAPAPVSAIPTFSSMKPKMAAVTAAVAAADEKAAAEASSEMDRETQRAKALGALPQDIPAAPAAKPVVKAPPPAPIQKPKLAPVPVAPPAPRESRAAKEPPSWNDPGASLRDQFGKPSDFMGTGVGASDFAKGVAAVAAINGDDKAKAYAGQLTSERPGISGVAFDALSNEYAKATGQAQTPTLYDRLASSTLGQAFGMTADIPAFNGYGASNSPKSQQGMFVQGANNQPTWANYSADQQRALQNSSGLWGSIQNAFGFGAGQNNGWGAPGSMGYGAGTSGLW